MKQLALKYFEGTITSKEEKQLQEFVLGSKANLLLFRQWEAAWKASHTMPQTAADAFNNFANIVSEAKHQQPSHSLFLSWQKMAIAAAVVLFLVGGAYVLWQHLMVEEEQYYCCSVPYGSKSKVQLPDGTAVWLNAGSSLRYSTRFNEHNRRVELKGEGFFDVSKSKNNAFVVSTHACDIVVKGTQFDVSAYSDDTWAQVSLMRGRVEVHNSKQAVTMKPGECVKVDVASGKMSKTRFNSSGGNWINGSLDIENISLLALTKILSRQFNVNFVIHSAQLQRTRFSVILKQKETAMDVMTALQSLQPMRIEKKDKTIHIYNKH